MVETGHIYGVARFQLGKSFSSPLPSSLAYGPHFCLLWEFCRENTLGYCQSLQLDSGLRDGVKCCGEPHLSDAVFPGQILELESIESGRDYLSGNHYGYGLAFLTPFKVSDLE